MCISNNEPLRPFIETTLKQNIISQIESIDTLGIVDSLVAERMEELSCIKRLRDKSNAAVLTCEITESKVYIVGHKSLKEAIEYSLSTLGCNISIIKDEEIINIYQYNDDIYISAEGKEVFTKFDDKRKIVQRN